MNMKSMNKVTAPPVLAESVQELCQMWSLSPSSKSYPVGSYVAIFMEKYRDEIPTVGKIVRDVAEIPHAVEVEW